MGGELSYANRIKFTSTNYFGNHAGLTAPNDNDLIGELRLEVKGPSGNPVASCIKNGANYKIVQFNPGDGEGPGTYTVKVYVYTAAGGGRTMATGSLMGIILILADDITIVGITNDVEVVPRGP